MKSLLAIAFFSLPVLNYVPIISPGLTAVYEHEKQLVKLKWNHQDNRVVKYILQRSADNNKWINIYDIKLDEPEYYKFISYYDNQVLAGRNYYRLKAILANGSSEFTPAIMVIIGKPGNNWLMYPVPVRDLLNLQYNGNRLITGVISVVIQRMNGQVYHQLRFASSTRLIQIPVNNLGSGTYDVRIIINNQVMWNQRFVK
jgi:hypothetical protein